LAVSPAGNGGYLLNWTPPNWRLQQTTNLTAGEWTDTPGSVPPRLIMPAHPQQFFRIRQP
jgi:hypothetical protein